MMAGCAGRFVGVTEMDGAFDGSSQPRGGKAPIDPTSCYNNRENS